jgi:predicted permease
MCEFLEGAVTVLGSIIVFCMFFVLGEQGATHTFNVLAAITTVSMLALFLCFVAIFIYGERYDARR